MGALCISNTDNAKDNHICCLENERRGSTRKVPKIVALDRGSTPCLDEDREVDDIRDYYDLGNMLGVGTFGTVRLA